MASARLEAMVRTWGCDTRRSLLLRLVAGTALGAGVLGRLGLDDAAAKCVVPGKKCKRKHGKKKKCCGGAKCQGKRCTCPGGAVGCGKECCQPGQVCQDGACGGPLGLAAPCDPETPLACQTGNCGCSGDDCTCRLAAGACLPPNAPCVGTFSCCAGVCVPLVGGPKCVGP